MIGLAPIVLKGVAARCRSIDGTHHSGFAVWCWLQLFTEEPDRLRIIGDGEVPLRNWCQARGGEPDPTGVEASTHGSAWIAERRLRDGMVSRHARELEVDDSPVRGIDTGRDELEDSTLGISGRANLDGHDS